MADLSRLIVSGNQAVNACNTAPILVRSYLAPLRDFVKEVVSSLIQMEEERIRQRTIARRILLDTPAFEVAMRDSGIDPDLIEAMKQNINAQAAGGTAGGIAEEKQP